MKMKFSLYVLSLVMLSIGCTRTPEPMPERDQPPVQRMDYGGSANQGDSSHHTVPLHRSFEIAKLVPAKDGSAVIKEQWRDSTQVVKKSEVTVAVFATWCPYSVELIEEISADPVLASQIDFLLLLDSEFDDAVARAVRENELTPEEAKQIQERARKENLFLVAPEVALAHKNLTFYVAKGEFFNMRINGYPSVLTCTTKECMLVRRPG